MIDVLTAHEQVERNCIKLATEEVSLEGLEGRVLSKPIYSTREQPPFDRVAMDGIAIKFSSLKNNLFPIEGIQKAGCKVLTLKNQDNAFEVMTGAILPKGVDTVIPYEVIKIENEVALLNKPEQVNSSQNIHFKGADYKEGKLLLRSGLKINSAAVAIIASQGSISAEVYSFPRIAIISTGDELVEPGQSCKPWQIWRSNAYALKAELSSFGFPEDKIKLFHLEDSKEKVFSSLKTILEDYQGLVISGGVSMGKFDFVQAVMSDLGVESIFYKIKQKPGKPMFFGKGREGQAIFALPGNPVSALVCMRRYVITSLNASFKNIVEPQKVILDEEVNFKKDFVLFKAVKIKSNEKAELIATPLKSNGSGDFSSLGESDGFIELPADKEVHKNGNIYSFYPWNGGNR
jgi:molybdopterin molybdotransferase